ncbi:hypothetical protein R3P38DRAFT_2572162 [Favolaschia claudopus]|uniref:Uncharacterized protein n=1 Tax=Favolaschia claudopus TaxID=2862362 RepID=A0AAV9ZRZ9_9AGAR
MKPNHHWAVHVPDQLIDYGPVHNFWAFLTERLNKLLKNLNSNNWTGGELEVSMMREYHRNMAVQSVSNSTELLAEATVIKQLAGNERNAEAMGTIQDAAQYTLSSSRIKFGTLASRMKQLADDSMRLALVNYYNQEHTCVYLNLREPGATSENILMPYADIYNYALLDGRRITSTHRSTRNNAGSSLIMTRFGDEACVGEVRAIFVHRQPNIRGSSDTILLMVAWLKESDDTPLDFHSFVWSKFPELGVNNWEYQEYEDPGNPVSHPLIIPLSRVHCQVSRGVIKHTDPWQWITTSMDRVSYLRLDLAWCTD